MKYSHRSKTSRYLIFPIGICLLVFTFYLGYKIGHPQTPTTTPVVSTKPLFKPYKPKNSQDLSTFTTTDGFAVQYPSRYSIHKVDILRGDYALFLNQETAKNCLSFIAQHHDFIDSNQKGGDCVSDTIFWETSQIKENIFIEKIFKEANGWIYFDNQSRLWIVFWDEAEGVYVDAYTKIDSSILDISMRYLQLPQLATEYSQLDKWDAEEEFIKTFLNGFKIPTNE